jgi:hypothetical protein
MMTTEPVRVGSLFSGYEGISLGLQQVFPDVEVAFVAEIDDGACKILDHRFSSVPNVGDVSAVDWKGSKMASNRKLTPTQVESAVKMYRDLEMSLAPIAEYFGVSRQAMWDLLRRRIELRPRARYGSANHFWRGGSKVNARAHDITEQALARGVLVRPSMCETCGGPGEPFKDGRSPIQAHHPDYNRPLDVMWLCQPCHHKWHQTNTAVAVEGGGANGSLADIEVLTGGFP